MVQRNSVNSKANGSLLACLPLNLMFVRLLSNLHPCTHMQKAQRPVGEKAGLLSRKWGMWGKVTGTSWSAKQSWLGGTAASSVQTTPDTSDLGLPPSNRCLNKNIALQPSSNHDLAYRHCMCCSWNAGLCVRAVCASFLLSLSSWHWQTFQTYLLILLSLCSCLKQLCVNGTA